MAHSQPTSYQRLTRARLSHAFATLVLEQHAQELAEQQDAELARAEQHAASLAAVLTHILGRYQPYEKDGSLLGYIDHPISQTQLDQWRAVLTPPTPAGTEETKDQTDA